MNTGKQRAFFASLHGSKFLCKECLELRSFKKYLKAGIIQLACGHERHTNQIDIGKWKEKQVMDILDGKFTTIDCMRFQHQDCASYECSCPCHKKEI